MLNQNIISKKFDLNLTTTLSSYSAPNGLRVVVNAKFSLKTNKTSFWSWDTYRWDTKSIQNFANSLWAIEITEYTHTEIIHALEGIAYIRSFEMGLRSTKGLKLECFKNTANNICIISMKI
jgi:hypothetical protein